MAIYYVNYHTINLAEVYPLKYQPDKHFSSNHIPRNMSVRASKSVYPKP